MLVYCLYHRDLTELQPLNLPRTLTAEPHIYGSHNLGRWGAFGPLKQSKLYVWSELKLTDLLAEIGGCCC